MQSQSSEQGGVWGEKKKKSKNGGGGNGERARPPTLMGTQDAIFRKPERNAGRFVC
jgi:hypothetical protein